MKPHFDARFQALAGLISKHRRIVQRVLLLLPLGAAFGLVAWSLHRLQPVLKATSAATDRVTRVSVQIDDLEQACARAEEEEVSRRFNSAMADYAAGEESVREWLIDLRERATPLAFALNAEIGEVVARDIGGQSLTLIPVRIELEPVEGFHPTRGVYERLMEFCRFLAGHRLRVDVVDMNVAGSAGSVGRAVLTVHLWARSSAS
jgi:hypothetical protein